MDLLVLGACTRVELDLLPMKQTTFLHWRFAVSKTAWSLSFDISKSYILIIYLFPSYSLIFHKAFWNLCSPWFVALILPLLIALRKSAFNSFKVACPIGKDIKGKLEQTCRSEGSCSNSIATGKNFHIALNFLASSQIFCTFQGVLHKSSGISCGQSFNTKYKTPHHQNQVH